MHESTRQKLSEARRGKPSGRLGHKGTPETSAKLSAMKKGIPLGPMSAETKKKLSLAMKGKSRRPWTPEERKMREGFAKGKPMRLRNILTGEVL